jgi:hypothetical protein
MLVLSFSQEREKEEVAKEDDDDDDDVDACIFRDIFPDLCHRAAAGIVCAHCIVQDVWENGQGQSVYRRL